MRAVTTRRVLLRAASLLATGVAVLWAAATLVFAVMRVLPGDPVGVMLGPTAQVSENTREVIRRQLGLDRPVLTQYLDYLGGLLRGDLGESYQLRKPVAEILAAQLGPTVQLAALALLLALVLATIGAALGRWRTPRVILAGLEQVVVAMPVFWIGLILLAVFAFGLGWFPVSGRGGAALVLPAVTLALPTAALLGQVFRDGVESAEREPFVESVRGRGVGPTRLLTHHTARHALLGTVPMAAYLVGSLLGGAVVVETVFARPGLGRVTLTAILDRDLPVISGVLLLSTLVFVVVSLLSDLVVPMLDPRRSVGRSR
ncbi:ABC transporter permease [Microbacterium gorillae]|uniref:ABC transporter permease n=1 Tax=Microbacterium gorillae TaxID=1231063 RepID=UPI000B0E7D04|nr:ABC transporter permease [Microbacterium gorillae]